MAKKKQMDNGDKVTIDDLNARTHPDRNKQAIRTSLEQFGAARSVVVDKDNRVLAGNGTVEQAEQLGLKVKVIDGKPGELIAIRRNDWTEDEARAYAIADNKTNDLSDFDFQQVASQFSNIDPTLYEATGFADYEIEPLLAAEWSPPPIEDIDDEYTAETVSVKFTTEQFQTLKELSEIRKLDPAAAAVMACAQMIKETKK